MLDNSQTRSATSLLVSVIIGLFFGLVVTDPMNKLFSSNIPENLVSFTTSFILYFAISRLLEKSSKK